MVTAATALRLSDSFSPVAATAINPETGWMGLFDCSLKHHPTLEEKDLQNAVTEPHRYVAFDVLQWTTETHKTNGTLETRQVILGFTQDVLDKVKEPKELAHLQKLEQEEGPLTLYHALVKLGAQTQDLCINGEQQAAYWTFTNDGKTTFNYDTRGEPNDPIYAKGAARQVFNNGVLVNAHAYALGKDRGKLEVGESAPPPVSSTTTGGGGTVYYLPGCEPGQS